ncbi:MAG: 4'-phosphopantetheinyl transferase superfamily protein [Prolixibacteraceae bacterium]|nr:4'-phosphopantetheinyl transferase superfamily protein [Prolixibacteraceae bacterium]
MPLFKTISVTNGLLAVWQITESSGELQSFFTSEELADPNFQKYTFEKRKVEWMAIRVLLKQMTGSGFEIFYTEVGKPVIKHPLYKHISISHSRDFATVYIHQYHSIGIDIESITRNYASVKKRYLSESELEQVKEDSVLQCIYWCAKEAVFKLVDKEGVDFRKQIHVLPFLPETNIFFVRYIFDNHVKTLQLQYESFNQHCLVWVCGDSAV